MGVTRKIVLEIAAGSLEDCVVAEAGGADRIELNSALSLGGLTPSLGTLIEAVAAVRIPVLAMIRPRPGGFRYSSGEFRAMRRDVDLMLEHGAAGVAFGVLDSGGAIDVERCAELVRQIGLTHERAIVFHRAFDVTPDPRGALDRLIDLGVTRVMTSGQQATALEGAALIGDMIHRAAGRIEVLPAAGITGRTARDLVTMTGAVQVHASLRALRGDDTSLAGRPHVTFNGSVTPGETRYTATDPAAVSEMRRILDER